MVPSERSSLNDLYPTSLAAQMEKLLPVIVGLHSLLLWTLLLLEF